MMDTHRAAKAIAAGLVGMAALLAWPATQAPALAADAEQAADTPQAEREISYAREVQPILSNACFACHGFDNNTREAELRLDQAADAFKDRGGYAAIVPGEPMESEVYLRMTEEHPADRMPPESHHHQPTEEQIEVIRRWIEQGAEYEDHWAFIPPQRPVVPEVSDADWPRNEIDHFVMAQLDEEGVRPSREADRRTLIRRVTLDLTGLPPTPEEVEAFVNDPSPNAYEELVDRLLASPRYGEHMARYWLDAVRYGDTHGLHLDNYREMWPYRDWVIRAFNKNKPFDEFTVEQIAGDLLENPTRDQLIATGYNRAHITTAEGGSIEEEVFMRNVADRTDTTGTVFLGLTMGCAQCHDHKFDPITQKDYYSFFAFFNSLDANPLDGNAAQHPPVIRVPNEQQEAKLAEFDQTVGELEAQRKQHRSEASDAFAAWVEKAPEQWAQRMDVDSDAVAHFKLNEGSGHEVASSVGEITGTVHGQNVQWEAENVPDDEPVLKFDGYTYVEAEGVGDFERDQAFSYGAWVRVNDINGADTIISRMDAANAHRGWDMYLANGQVMIHMIHAWPDNTLRLNTREKLKAGEWQHVMVTYDGSSKPEGLAVYIDGDKKEVEVTHNSLSETIRTEAKFRIGKRTDDTPLRNGAIGDVVVFDRSLSAEEVRSLAGADRIGNILATAAEERTDEQRQALREYYFENVDEQDQAITAKLAAVRQERKELHDSLPTTLIWKEKAEPRQAHIRLRGQYHALGDPVERAVPEFLPPLPEDQPQDRLGLARWLVSEDQPLMPRVMVNRFWQQVFGTGLVKTAGDFGIQGEFPTHPDLLDYLAVEFRENGWDVKDLMRQIVTSATYRQHSGRGSELQDRDPANRLLARGPRFRLDGEVLRDQALAASGLLVEQIGGPGVKPPQPDGLWEAVGYSSSDTSNFEADTGSDKVHRRSIYTFWKRTSPPPQMTLFDAPSRESCTVQRERTNTPLQALVMMNDVQFVEPARALAERAMLEAGPAAEQRAAWMFSRLTARQPGEVERREMISLYEDMAEDYSRDTEAAAELVQNGDQPPHPDLDKAELAAWTMVANLLLNLDEVINKN